MRPCEEGEITSGASGGGTDGNKGGRCGFKGFVRGHNSGDLGCGGLQASGRFGPGLEMHIGSGGGRPSHPFCHQLGNRGGSHGSDTFVEGDGVGCQRISGSDDLHQEGFVRSGSNSLHYSIEAPASDRQMEKRPFYRQSSWGTPLGGPDGVKRGLSIDDSQGKWCCGDAMSLSGRQHPLQGSVPMLEATEMIDPTIKHNAVSSIATALSPRLGWGQGLDKPTGTVNTKLFESDGHNAEIVSTVWPITTGGKYVPEKAKKKK